MHPRRVFCRVCLLLMVSFANWFFILKTEQLELRFFCSEQTFHVIPKIHQSRSFKFKAKTTDISDCKLQVILFINEKYIYIVVVVRYRHKNHSSSYQFAYCKIFCLGRSRPSESKFVNILCLLSTIIKLNWNAIWMGQIRISLGHWWSFFK